MICSTGERLVLYGLVTMKNRKLCHEYVAHFCSKVVVHTFSPFTYYSRPSPLFEARLYSMQYTSSSSTFRFANWLSFVQMGKTQHRLKGVTELDAVSVVCFCFWGCLGMGLRYCCLSDEDSCFRQPAQQVAFKRRTASLRKGLRS